MKMLMRHEAVAMEVYNYETTMGGCMDGLESLVNNAIDHWGERYQDVLIQFEEYKKDEPKHRALSKYFGLSREDQSQLKSAQEELVGVPLNNTLFCLKRFLAAEATIVERQL